MTENNNESAYPNIKLFPIILGIVACAFLYIVSYYRNRCAIIGSLGSLTFTMLLFLILITGIDFLNKSKLWEKGKKFFIKNKVPREIIQEEEKTSLLREQRDDLIEIKKVSVLQPGPESISPEKRVYQILYITFFLGIAFWRIGGMFKVLPLSYADDYKCSIVDSVLLLVFPCVAALYLKIRNESDSCPAETVSRGILTLFSYVSFIYAAVIAAVSVLNINMLVVLPWVYYAASVYIAVSLAVNIALSMLKGNVLHFDYTLIPNIALTKNKNNQFAESVAKWKVSLKSLYTIRYTLTILPGLAMCLLFILFVSTAFFVVQPHQQAAVYHFGKLNASSIKDAGFHVKFPWPIDKADIYDTHRVASMQIGYESSGTANFLWTQKHDGGEYMLLLGNGNEMTAVNLKLMYVISDLYSYIKTFTNPEAILAAAAYNALMSRTVNTTLDVFLNVDRNSLSESVLNELSAFCTSENLGFTVVQVIIESIHPPVDIADVYQNVVSASVDKTTAITRAHSYAEAKIIEAARLSATAVNQAKALRHSRTSDAQKEAAVFYAATDANRISPGSYQLTKNLDVYEKVISGKKVYVFSRGAESGMSKFYIGKVNTINLPDANKGEGNE